MTVAAGADPDAADDVVTLTLTALGADYAAPERALTVTVGDIDTAGLKVAGAPVTVDEEGATPGTFTVVLETAPAPGAPVTVTVSGLEGTDLKVLPSSHTFTAKDWDRPKTFEVTAGTDPDAQDDAAVLVLTPAGSAEYDALEPTEVAVAVRDDDAPGLKLSATQLEVAEAGAGPSRCS